MLVGAAGDDVADGRAVAGCASATRVAGGVQETSLALKEGLLPDIRGTPSPTRIDRTTTLMAMKTKLLRLFMFPQSIPRFYCSQLDTFGRAAISPRLIQKARPGFEPKAITSTSP